MYAIAYLVSCNVLVKIIKYILKLKILFPSCRFFSLGVISRTYFVYLYNMV
jgi:hypothetical protein